MKKLFVFAASAMMVFASCTDNEIVYQNETPQEISLFSVANNMTRGAQEGTFTHTNMTVAAYLVANSTVGVEEGGDYFDGTDFTKTGDATNFTGGKYWPIQNATLNFLAVAPSNDDVTTVFGSGADEETGTENSNFAGTATVTVANINTNQHDVMYAKGTGAKNSGAVGMEFQHALAWVNFTFKAGMAGITIKNVTVYGANYSGTLTVTQTNFDKATGQSVAAVWSDKEGLESDGVSVPYASLPATGVALTKDAAATPWGQGLLVVPSAPTKFVIDYTVAYESGTYNYKYTHELMNNDDNDQITNFTTEWAQGTKYTYNVTMNFGNLIEINPTVATWGTSNDTDITIQ